MKFIGLGEFRGKEEKKSAKGNSYYSLIFEDVDNGQQLRFYSPLSATYSVSVGDLQKGSLYDIRVNYHYDFSNWNMDLLDIKLHQDKK